MNFGLRHRAKSLSLRLLLEVRDYCLQMEIFGVANCHGFSSLNESFEDTLVTHENCRLCFEKKLCNCFVFNVFWNIVAFLSLRALITCCNF